ncbi:hypothetical protein [Lentibacillus amyloliquefaciens]|uniref:Transporter n=1 Tax=Lentibacillus amyloliquefaciens TaxID=1472767 RepID=A0A0U4F1A4_9BACI|nr:hypothetical protein [Lentibacillus amyloliquefaciens]ALX49287.1 hypothetical protein AOX59_12225 [Lentibacillus amyloliquefaciens]
MNHNQPPYDDARIFNLPWFQDGGPGSGPPFGGPPGQSGGGPPFSGPPGQSGGGPPSGFPGGQQQVSAPSSPPPSFTPQQPQTQQVQGDFGVFAVDPGAIQRCLFRFTYIWLRWDSFWFFPVFIGRQSIAGFRWQQNRWVYYGVDLNNIQSFQCY